MPIVGHAFVGLAVAMWTHPRTTTKRLGSWRTAGRVLWTSQVVGLSYLPDILAQLGLLLLEQDFRHITHAALTALFLAFALTPLFISFREETFHGTFLFVFGCLLLHDALDLLQTTDRNLWWPFSYKPIALEVPLIPIDPLKEAGLFAIVYLLCLVVYQLQYRGSPRRSYSFQGKTWRQQSLSWLNVAICSTIMFTAGGTHYFRQIREEQLEHARQLSQEQHAYQEALVTLQQAERWPSTAKPGRIDYLRAWTYEQIGDSMQAEVYYLRAYHADPTYFWTIADLVIFYASSDRPLAERRQLIALYLKQLYDEFSDHQDLPNVLDRIAHALATASTAADQPLSQSTMQHP